MAVMHFGQNGIRITLSDDMVRVGGAALERAYVMLLRQCNIQRMQAVHGTKGEVNV